MQRSFVPVLIFFVANATGRKMSLTPKGRNNNLVIVTFLHNFHPAVVLCILGLTKWTRATHAFCLSVALTNIQYAYELPRGHLIPSRKPAIISTPSSSRLQNHNDNSSYTYFCIYVTNLYAYGYNRYPIAGSRRDSFVRFFLSNFMAYELLVAFISIFYIHTI